MTDGYVLVHGGSTTGRFWDRLVPLLDGPTIAPDLPGRGVRPDGLATLTVDECAAAVVSDLACSAIERFVLVAHSSGGLAVPAIVSAVGSERVKAIVLSAASVPPEGGNGLDCMKPRHAESLQRGLVALRDAEMEPTSPPPRPERIRDSSGELLDDGGYDFMVDPLRCVGESMTVYLTPVYWSAARAVPVTYVVNLRDRALDVDLQRTMASRVPQGADVIDLDCGHLAPVTRAPELAKLINARQEERWGNVS